MGDPTGNSPPAMPVYSASVSTMHGWTAIRANGLDSVEVKESHTKQMRWSVDVFGWTTNSAPIGSPNDVLDVALVTRSRVSRDVLI